MCLLFFMLHAGRGKVNKDAGISYCGGVKAG
ncbi:hypothetical protein EAOG_02542 [Escherichia coli R527]|uniref:Uncharacterized protein n=1 Tax=Escherichia coli M605 TaxID=656417 RepID=F4SV75_ECOLX|nr:conserved hypothetical protein [Escherichia coli M605]EGI46523.1 conserved hypothetical protein [Escherichia coli H591]OSK14275.1 hypothetical protein EAOG_02542 [Escherichia coli R527]OSL38225.1 hypothetical protein EAQG_00572 [Escherichia coli TA464]